VLLNLPLSRSELDRAAHLRSDETALAEMWQRAKIIELIDDQFRTRDEALDYVYPDVSGDRFFLGLDKAGTPYFVAHRRGLEANASGEFQTLRTIGKKLNDLEIGAAVHALALAQWHEIHQRCAKCGGPTEIGMAGAIRKCSSCAADHHPRTDPAIIVLVKDESDRILLGRQKVWPEKRFSTFAGFVEPGESFESTVIREVSEECGGQVISMNYLGSQPWPFPASIMIAYEAVISNPGTTKADGEEIEEIIWLDRNLLKTKVAAKELLLPPAISVARAMINSWYGSDALRDLATEESWRNVGR
jgi:NAD+ diphosphatase